MHHQKANEGAVSSKTPNNSTKDKAKESVTKAKKTLNTEPCLRKTKKTPKSKRQKLRNQQSDKKDEELPSSTSLPAGKIIKLAYVK